MGEPPTSAAMCKVCGHRHWLRDPHVWADGSKESKKDKVVTELKRAIVNKCADRGPEPDKQVNIPIAAFGSLEGVNPASAKKPWVKPVLKRYVRAPLSDVAVHGKHGKYADLEKRKECRKEYMRKRRQK